MLNVVYLNYISLMGGILIPLNSFDSHQSLTFYNMVTMIIHC